MGPHLEQEIQRARAGDPRAFRTVTEILGPPLIRFVTVYLRGDVHAAHDVVQETFLEAWRHLDRLETADRMRAWLYRVARCRAVTWLRRRGPASLRVLPLDDDRDGPAPAGPPGAGEASIQAVVGRGGSQGGRPAPPDPSERPTDLLDRLRVALRGIPPIYQVVVELHYLHGFDTYETAELLDVPRTTVKMRLHRARRLLRRALGTLPGAVPDLAAPPTERAGGTP